MHHYMSNPVARGRAWLATVGAALSPHDPYYGATLLARRAAGEDVDLARLAAYWLTRLDGCNEDLRRYPWGLSYRRSMNPPSYAGPMENWESWRAAERRLSRGFELAYWFLVPVVVCRNGELLEELAAQGNLDARTLLERFGPVMRRDFAQYVMARHPWTDTFALWNLTRTERLLERLYPLAVALASTFAAAAREAGGVVKGLEFPYYEKPLASASAHLAAGLLALGLETALVASLLERLAGARRVGGGWADGDDPAELMTTFVVADLLSSVDPGFNPGEAVAFIGERQEPDGGWRVLGPEMPWLTDEIVRWLERMSLPFDRRFRWPRLSEATVDSKTRLPGYGYFRACTELCAGLPGLAASAMELAFLDMAGFKKFNDRFGQDAGDECIVLLAQTLDAIPGARAVRDGGDEFLILGAPTDVRLEERLHAFREGWPAVFRARFGDDAPVVAPRICLATGRGGALSDLRETLGRAITALKREAPVPGSSGVLKRV